MRGIILYGPPASGKDTITQALSTADPRCRLFRRLKAGAGKSSTYRMVSAARIEELRRQGDIAWTNARYGATYAIDIRELRSTLRDGIPILHLGQVDAIPAVRSAVPGASWLIAELWCARKIAAERLARRNPSDTHERLRVWDETAHLTGADVVIDTGQVEPTRAAQSILRAFVP